jgi:hypothetical protein
MKSAKIIKAVLKVIGILATLCAISFSFSASAVPIAYTYGNCGYSTGSKGCNAYGGYASADLGTLTATAQMSGDATHAGGINENVVYYFELVSSTGAPYYSVPLLVSVNLVTTMGGGGGTFNNGFAQAGVSVGSIGESACSGSSYYCLGSPATFAGDIHNNISSNWLYQVIVSATAIVNSDAPTSMYASADPYIRVDPVFLSLHPDLSLTFSDGITNAPPTGPGPNPVPAPATVWLFAAGLLGWTGVAQRRRTTQKM